jgi:hypothetical protein
MISLFFANLVAVMAVALLMLSVVGGFIGAISCIDWYYSANSDEIARLWKWRLLMLVICFILACASAAAMETLSEVS